jgi:hypothetical protein
MINQEKPYYIAIHKGGYGINQNPAAAIRAAQKSVKIKSRPTQLLIYRSDNELIPTGFVEWPNGAKPTLVGLTTTHQLWQPKRSLTTLSTASIKRSFDWIED